MKRLISLLCMFILLAGLVACGNKSDVKQGETDTMKEKDAKDTAINQENNGAKESEMSGMNHFMEAAFHFETKTVTLNSGYEMPINGIGTYSLLDDVCIKSVTEALNRGVRLIDTAYMYHNDVICCEV